MPMSDTQRERELKFAVPDDFVVPDLSPLLPAGGSVERGVVTLESTYYDTAARDLLGAGLTLRRRTGDDDTGWQLKVPDGDSRIEVRVPLGGRGVPAELRELTAGARGRSALKPIATLRTERHVHRLLDDAGDSLAEVVDDSVVSHTQREFAITRSWREVEVELHDGSEKLLKKASTLLHDHGAEDATIGSKLRHALDVADAPAPDPDMLSGTIARYLDEQFEALVRGDVQLRRGEDVVHPTRVATRRYRSVLRIFGRAFDPARAEHLDVELKWFAAALGEVRDAQVLRRHLDDALDDLPADLVIGPVRTRIDRALDAEEDAARQALATLMAGPRYLALVRDLRSWREDLPLLEDGPAREVKKYLRRAERKLDKRLSAARGADRGDETHHRARKAAKRTRYVAELARPVLGSKARKSAKRAKKLQQRFGDRQDNVLAARFLLRLGAETGRNGFTFGLLYQRERAHGDAIA
ncbi:CYTH and CHAD domain-containing protein [Jatrophihabitans endophyticus]|uniref:CYTH and CHAD domain-containing protein n=1 Tax=Jatrophihabitans endophyticus TaxID=1206085 RepID=UPI0019D9CC34|nr:CYTH and CHAD domain-containing protein [Jatrophihabitans endophyticus]MBE7187420.1 CYTH and CHAD domain-containing protein [Jatrophihabitans endophyticus]